MGMNDFTPGYTDEYLAHSKGPWKKHKYIRKVGNRYYYHDVPLSKIGNRYYGAMTEQHKKKIDRAEKSAETARKNRYKHYGIVAKNAVSGAASESGKQIKGKARYAKAATSATMIKAKQAGKKAYRSASSAVSEAAGKVAKKAKNAKYLTSAKVSVTKFKASQGAKRLKKNASAAAEQLAKNTKGRARYAKATASAYGIKAKQATKKNLRKAKTTVSSATKSGMAAINSLMTKGKYAGRTAKAKYKGSQNKRNLNKITKKVNKRRSKNS